MIRGQGCWLLGGGIGSGKSVVRTLLERRGIKTVDADAVGHAVLEPGAEAYEVVAEQWPSAVRDGIIDRSLLAEIVFGDAAELRRLEGITHPHIFGRIRSLVEGFDGPLVVEIPLLRPALGSEWGQIVVDSDDETRLGRAMARGLSREDVLARMRTQPAREGWLAAADLVIPNHRSLRDLEKTVDQVVGLL